jgi:hypothetical protein
VTAGLCFSKRLSLECSVRTERVLEDAVQGGPDLGPGELIELAVWDRPRGDRRTRAAAAGQRAEVGGSAQRTDLRVVHPGGDGLGLAQPQIAGYQPALGVGR